MCGRPESIFLPILLILLAMLSVASPPALAQRYHIKTYSEGDGLPSAAVNSIAQDHSGLMWFATRSGIASYDGYEWRVYGLADGLPSLNHVSILVDSDGYVWALSINAELSVLKGGKWRMFEKLPLVNNQGGPYIMAASVMSGGRPAIILAGTDNELKYFDGDVLRTLSLNGAPTQPAWCGVAVVDSLVFAATPQGLFSVPRNALARGLEHVEGTPRIPIVSLAYDEIRDILWLVGLDWIGTLERGGIKILHRIRRLDPSLRYGPFSCVPDDIGGLYYGNQNYLYRFDGWGGTDPMGRNSGIIDEGCLSLFRDREGNIWVTGLRGISRIDGIRFASFSKDNGLFDDEVTAVLERKSGGIVLGHPCGLTFIDGTMRRMAVTDDKQLERILDLTEDGAGRLWVAANEGGLIRIDADDRKTVFGVKDGLDPQIRSVLVDRRGRLWVLGNERIFIRAGDRFDPVPIEVPGIRSHPGFRILYEASDGTVYAGTSVFGAIALEEKKNPRVFAAGTSSANSVYSICKAADSTLYVGTYDGLYRESKGVLKLSVPPGPAIDRPVYFIIEDRENRLWFGTDNGVYRWNGDDLSHFTAENGLLGRETNRAAGLVDSQGRVWIGTDRGVSVYHEEYDKRRKVLPAVTLDSLQTADAAYSLEDTVSLNYDQNSFTVSFRTILFSSEERIRIMSRLEGCEPEWSEPYASPERQLRYTNLPPGKYVFHLQAAVENGPWSETASSQPIIIRGPFWSSLWFRLLAGALAALFAWSVIALFLQRRYASLLRKEVEIKVAEKREMEKELARAGKLKSMGILAGGIAHDFNNFLAAIMGNLSMLEASRHLSDEDKELTSHALAAAKRARSLTSQLLTFSKGGTPVLETGDIRSIIREIAAFIMRGSKSSCVFDLPEDLRNVEMDADQISQVINNILLNARQAMPGGGVIEIRARNHEYSLSGAGPRLPSPGSYVAIEIEDHGEGIPASIIEHIFDPYFTTRPDGTGLGLTTAYSIVEKHGGRIEVRSVEGSGTAVSFYLPAAAKTASDKTTTPAETAAEVRRARVLVMDDDDAVRTLTAQMLGMLGHSTGVALNGREALDLYRKGMEDGRPWDIVIMDLTIPGGMGGRETIGPLLQMDPGARVIVLSGYSNDDVLANYGTYGFRARLAKPFTKDDLARAISAVLKP
jgi:signal transduction histidine kinase/CheY-like chemotaxis protein